LISLTEPNLEKEKIHTNDRLLRRVQFLHPSFIKPDGTPTSASFSLKKGENGLSVDLERLADYRISILDPARFRLFVLNASFTESLGLTNEHDPLPENPAHTLLKGEITKAISKRLAFEAKRLNYP
jgi:hypothetical protein